MSLNTLVRYEFRIADLPYHIVRKALSKNIFYVFNNLVSYFPNINSLKEFVSSNDYLWGLYITFSGAEGIITDISNKHLLKAVDKLLQAIEYEIKSNIVDFKGSKEFKPKSLRYVFDDKVLKIRKWDERTNWQEDFISNKKWYVFNANYWTSEEKKLVEMLDRLMANLELKYQDIYLVRNELHFKIYNFNDWQAFAPDFVLFLREKEGETLTYQIFIEPKWKHLKEQDKWKEDFLKEIKEWYKDKLLKLSNQSYKVIWVPFYNYEEENEFKKSLYEVV